MLHSDKPWLFLILFIAIFYGTLSNTVASWVLKLLGGVILSLYAAYFAADFLCAKLPQRKVSPEGKAVFITGCDSGFGFRLAVRLDQLGFQVFAGCLIPQGDGAKQLRVICSKALHIVPLDVTVPEIVHTAVEYVKVNLGKNDLWAVVNNAGIFIMADSTWCGDDAVKKTFDVNVMGVVRVTRAFIPLLAASKGRVVVVTSFADEVVLGGTTVYSMSKHAVRSFTTGLRMEVRSWGITVIAVQPGGFRTNITNAVHLRHVSQKTWEEAPEEIRKLYPKNYFDDCFSPYLGLCEYIVSPHVHAIVDCLENAVHASHPRTHYQRFVWRENLAFLLHQFLPSAILHSLPLDVTNIVRFQDNISGPIERFLGNDSWRKCHRCSLTT